MKNDKLETSRAPVKRVCEGYAKNNAVSKPAHYTKGDIECIDAMASACFGLSGMEAVCTANALKYLWRWKHKNGVEDLEKAKWYIDKLIKELKK